MSAKCKTHMISDYTLGYSRYSYETTDTVEDLERTGYFDPAAGILRPRDLIDVWANLAGDPVFRTYAVATIDSEKGTVAVRRLEELGGHRVGDKTRPAGRKAPANGSRPRARA